MRLLFACLDAIWFPQKPIILLTLYNKYGIIYLYF